jgi:UDP-3-O-[3-hydroxymyristoyl] N-acetylglucosamine deacetylase
MTRPYAGRQTTLQDQATVAGIGVHSGAPATLTLHPAEADTGIVFLRCGTDGQPDRELSANFRAVTATEFATVLGDRNGPAVSTTEHVLAALQALGVDNAVVEVDGPEVPIMDGSAAPFVAAIDQAGIVTLPASRR